MTSTIDFNQKNFPIQKIIPFGEQYISREMFNYLTKSCTFPPIAIEEINSDLWCYSYDGYGKVTFKDGSVYTGGTKFGILTNEIDKSRPCEILFSDGEKYVGEVKDNILTGKAKVTFPSGNKYEGGISCGLRHGKGVYRDVDGLIFEGEYKYGVKEGYGRMKRGNITYEGTFHNNAIEGYGRLSWDNGNQYEGEFKNNKLNGVGTMYWASLGEKYTGQWKDNKENGFGIYIWYEKNSNSKSLRNRYIGYWIDGVREGYGVFFYSNDTKYEGFWEKNEKNGFGVFRFKNGTEYIGEFVQDRMINYLTEGIVKLNQDDVNYFDYDEKLDGKKKYNLYTTTVTSAQTTLERKNSKSSSVLPQINGSKTPEQSETGTNNSKLEVIMENENSKIDNNSNLKNKKPKIKISKKEDKSSNVIKQDKQEINNLSPRALYDELEKRKKDTNQITEIKVMKDQHYIASNRMINEIGNNQFLSIIDLSDIFEFEAQYEQTQIEVSNSILRNISEFTKIYNRLLKLGANADDESYLPRHSIIGDPLIELNESLIKPKGDNKENNKESEQKMKMDLRFNPNLSKRDSILSHNSFKGDKKEKKEKSSKKDKNDQRKSFVGEKIDKKVEIKENNQEMDKKESKDLSKSNTNQEQAKKKTNLIESVPLNQTFADDKIGVCLELKDIWKFFRDYGIYI